LAESHSTACTALNFPLISVNLITEFFNGSDWLPNDQDQCTSLILANHIQLTTTVDGLQAGNRAMTIKNGTTGAALANPIISGNGALTLSPSGQDNQGFVDIRSNISVAYPWLLELNKGEAQSRASFGLYTGDDNIIFRRERF